MIKEQISDNFYRVRIKRNKTNINLQQLVAQENMKADVGYDYENNYIVMINDYELDRLEKIIEDNNEST